jgi:hypothetical protein
MSERIHRYRMGFAFLGLIGALASMWIVGCEVSAPHQVPASAPQPDEAIADETLEQARACGIDYPTLLRCSRSGDADALGQLMRLSKHTDAAGALGHGVELVDILLAVGDDRFSAIVSAQDAETRAVTARVLEAGFAYTHRTDLKLPASAGYPLTHAALAD